MSPSIDQPWLAEAARRAQNSLWISNPNPRVACIIASPSGELLGKGHTQQVGGPHAEIMALRDASANGVSVAGATAYVTLEPCSHHGRTGPCCDALIAAGIARVVAATTDPNPLVAGQGFAKLRAAGVQVDVLDPSDPLATECRALNIGFFSRMVRKTPWVRMKVAASLDGTTALNTGASQWITSAQARADGHAWRARACAILTGIGTVLADRPTLDARLVQTPRQPHLAVVDSQLRTPPDAPFFIAGRAVFIYTAVQNAAKQRVLEQRGARVICLPQHDPDGRANGKVNLDAMLKDLGQRDINELHVEAGHTLNGALLQAGLVDEFLVYLAPTLLGQGAGMFRLGPFTELAQGLALEFKTTAMVGPDLRVLAQMAGRAVF